MNNYSSCNSIYHNFKQFKIKINKNWHNYKQLLYQKDPQLNHHQIKLANTIQPFHQPTKAQISPAHLLSTPVPSPN